jgi:hypothetical protein
LLTETRDTALVAVRSAAVQAQLGHADATLTLNTYAAVIADHADELADRLDSLRAGAIAHASRTDRARKPTALRGRGPV